MKLLPMGEGKKKLLAAPALKRCLTLTTPHGLVKREPTGVPLSGIRSSGETAQSWEAPSKSPGKSPSYEPAAIDWAFRAQALGLASESRSTLAAARALNIDAKRLFQYSRCLQTKTARLIKPGRLTRGVLLFYEALVVHFLAIAYGQGVHALSQGADVHFSVA